MTYLWPPRLLFMPMADLIERINLGDAHGAVMT